MRRHPSSGSPPPIESRSCSSPTSWHWTPRSSATARSCTSAGTAAAVSPAPATLRIHSQRHLSRVRRVDGALVDANENPSGLPCSDHLLVDDDRHAVVREAVFLQDLVAKDVVELVAAHGTGNLRLIVSSSLRRAPRCRGCCGSSTSPGGSDDTCGGGSSDTRSPCFSRRRRKCCQWPPVESSCSAFSLRFTATSTHTFRLELQLDGVRFLLHDDYSSETLQEILPRPRWTYQSSFRLLMRQSSCPSGDTASEFV